MFITPAPFLPSFHELWWESSFSPAWIWGDELESFILFSIFLFHYAVDYSSFGWCHVGLACVYTYPSVRKWSQKHSKSSSIFIYSLYLTSIKCIDWHSWDGAKHDLPAPPSYKAFTPPSNSNPTSSITSLPHNPETRWNRHHHSNPQNHIWHHTSGEAESCSFRNYDFTASGGDEVITQSLGLELLGPWLSLGFVLYLGFAASGFALEVLVYVDPWTRVCMLYVSYVHISSSLKN